MLRTVSILALPIDFLNHFGILHHNRAADSNSLDIGVS
jgi:hypothetical protein